MNRKHKIVLVVLLLLLITVVSVHMIQQRAVFKNTFSLYLKQLLDGNDQINYIIQQQIPPENNNWNVLTDILYNESELFSIVDKSHLLKLSSLKVVLNKYVKTNSIEGQPNSNNVFYRTPFFTYVSKSIKSYNSNSNVDFSYDKLKDILEIRRQLVSDLQMRFNKSSGVSEKEYIFSKILKAQEKITQVLSTTN